MFVIQKINELLWNQVVKLESDQDHGYNLNQLNQFQNDKTIIKIGILQDQKLVGYLLVKDVINFYEILKIFVAKEWRNQKAASKLLNNFLKQHSTNDIWLEVNTKNQAAINLYQKFNFQINRIRKQYYGSDDAYEMVLKYKD